MKQDHRRISAKQEHEIYTVKKVYRSATKAVILAAIKEAGTIGRKKVYEKLEYWGYKKYKKPTYK